ncbi:MAG: phaC PHA synthase [Gammaproteobacteria bacterium]|jgi:hypothetical protein|nr:phaC PHA synthase [Gammaproteobacteria bacterium]
MNKVLLLCALAGLSISLPAAADGDSVPLQLSTLNNTNAPEASRVEGARLALLYGKSGHVSGVDFPLGYSELDSLKGVSFPILIGANRIRKEMVGVSFGLFNWHEGADTGANFGAVNLTNNVNGLNAGWVNYSTGKTVVDLSIANISEASTVQLGFLNVTDRIDGIQIGLLNCAKNGFLPCFPFFNIGKQ